MAVRLANMGSKEACRIPLPSPWKNINIFIDKYLSIKMKMKEINTESFKQILLNRTYICVENNFRYDDIFESFPLNKSLNQNYND